MHIFKIYKIYETCQVQVYFVYKKYNSFEEQLQSQHSFWPGKLKKMARLLLRWHANLKNWHASGRWHAKLKNWHAFGTLARLLARWDVTMRSWHAFGTLERRPRWHAWYISHAIQQTLITPISKVAIRKKQVEGLFFLRKIFLLQFLIHSILKIIHVIPFVLESTHMLELAELHFVGESQNLNKRVLYMWQFDRIILQLEIQWGNILGRYYGLHLLEQLSEGGRISGVGLFLWGQFPGWIFPGSNCLGEFSQK